VAEPYVGQIISVGFNFAPLGWFLCNGDLKPIAQYETLYTLLGTMYGGDGTQTFALPNLNGRVPLGSGQGPGLSNYVQGQMQGTESVTLIGPNTPPHTHTISFSKNAATGITPKPDSGSVAVGANAQTLLNGLYTKTPATIALMGGMIQPAIGGQPHENRQQFLALNYIIAWAGIFPSQN
jgi:microcystin-dependent protein